MSRENVEVVRRITEAFRGGGLSAVLPLFDRDFEFHEDPAFPEAGVYRGREEFPAYARDFLATWETPEFELERTIEAGDRVVALLHIRWRGKESGAHVDVSPGWVWTVRGGKAVRCEGYLRRDDALRTVGLVE